MKIKIKTHLREYASNYYYREDQKQNAKGQEIWKEIQAGADPIQCMKRSKDDGGHEYKLPREDNDIVVVAVLDAQADVEGLMIQKIDGWVSDEIAKCVERNPDLKPGSSRRLGDLAATFLNGGYFAQHYDAAKHQPNHTQLKCYNSWKKGKSLEGVLKDREKPCIQYVAPGDYEILDGWGRLLPFAALLKEGFPFHPVETFLALPNQVLGSMQWHSDVP